MKTPLKKEPDCRNAICLETKSCPLGHAIWLAGLCWFFGAVGPRAAAQTPAGLELQLYAGLSITGAVGTVYSIEYVTDLAQTNNASAWRCLEFLQLPASPYLWADKSAPATGKRFYRAVQTEAPTNLVFIPPGTFRMGSPTNEVDRQDDEGPQTAVTISRGFWMGKYEVTQGEYLAVMGSNPSYFTGDANRPVEQVNWFDATNYCGQLTQRERAAGRIATNSVYRLPTEAEWEYACRAGTTTAFHYGNALRGGMANFDSHYEYDASVGSINVPNPTAYLGRTTTVGSYQPNAFGLYDMHGNVWEWCLAWFGYYPVGSVTDPRGPALGSARVLRGGSWLDGAWSCRSAARFLNYPDLRNYSFGFRPVLAPGQ